MLVQPWIKRKLRQVIPFMLTGLVFGIIYALIERSLIGDLDYYPSTDNPYDFSKNSVSTILQALSMGTLLGLCEVFLFESLFNRHHFIVKFMLKSVIYILAILILVAAFSVITTSVIQNIGLFHPMVWNNLHTFFTDMMFWAIMVYIGAVFSVAILITEMSHHLGDGVFRKFLFGKYQRPREEERIFMFLDMKGSTTLAENMGHMEYFNFLNDYYADISEAIIATEGEIYQYVGDEVVITWAQQNKAIYDKCITCFFSIKNIIRQRADVYRKLYGQVPVFKAGFHCGKVVTGRIGILKKELVFTGDVLNTAARIQGVCNLHNVDNLMSEPLVIHLKKISVYQFKEIGDIQLRGKSEKLKLFTV